MVTIETLDEQLRRAESPIRGWGRAELKELCKILLPGETLYAAVNGQYDAGFAMLVATDFRVLLVDKKPKYLTLRDIRYDMITELSYSHKLLNSTLKIFTPNRELHFSAFNKSRLHKLFSHSQHKVMEIRNLYMMSQFQQQELAKNMPPGLMMAMQRHDQAVDVEPLEERKPQEIEYFNSQLAPENTEAGTQRLAEKATAPSDPNEEHHSMAAAMAHAGLRSIVRNGRVIKEHVSGPLSHLKRKRPYGYSKDSLPAPGRQQPAT